MSAMVFTDCQTFRTKGERIMTEQAKQQTLTAMPTKPRQKVRNTPTTSHPADEKANGSTLPTPDLVYRDPTVGCYRLTMLEQKDID